MSNCYRFSHAIVRSPGASIAGGLRAEDAGNPNPAQFEIEHQAYITALTQTGVDVQALPALEEFPDSVFIEDSSLCLPKGAVIMRPGAPSRTGESKAMAAVLAPFFTDIRHIGEAGFIDGGDILVTENEIIVGLSQRTNADGAKRLQDCVADWKMQIRVLDTPADVLHFKTACGLLDEETILLTAQMESLGVFDAYRTLVIPQGEEAAANAIRVNDRVFISVGFPKTAELVTKAGYQVITLATGEAAKVDGGLSCMSLRFTPAL
jgi:dimethylargininase